MKVIVNYNNTLCELNSAKIRLNLLMDRKEALYSKYFPMSKPLTFDKVDGGNGMKDPMNEYMIELTTPDEKTGKSLEQEINEQRDEITKLDQYIRLMDTTLDNLTGLEADLYKYIVKDGMKISKAVEKVAELNYKDTSTIWRMYHRTIKSDINKLKIY